MVPVLKTKLFQVSQVASDLGQIFSQIAPNINSPPSVVEEYATEIAVDLGKLARLGNNYNPGVTSN